MAHTVDNLALQHKRMPRHAQELVSHASRHEAHSDWEIERGQQGFSCVKLIVLGVPARVVAAMHEGEGERAALAFAC